MKLIIVMALLLAAPVYADDVQFCTRFADVAGKIMEHRQNGVEMSAIANLFKTHPQRELVMKMATDAYSRPRMRVEKNQKRYVVDFKNKYFLACMKARSK